MYQTCKEMQKRITQLIGNISNENIISNLFLIINVLVLLIYLSNLKYKDELLRANDDLNNAFLRYERFQKNQPSQPQVDVNRQTSRREEDKPLIDFEDGSQAAASARFNDKRKIFNIKVLFFK